MADKILRPIVDVEIVEQMTENDTVLIEQNGAIKRTKGVVGGCGERYIIETTAGADGTLVVSWATPVSYEEFASKFASGEDIRVIQRMLFGALGVVAVSEASIMASFNETMDAIMGFSFTFAGTSFPPIVFLPDGTLQIQQG